MYYRTKQYYLFLFSIANNKDIIEQKKTYFFIRKEYPEVIALGKDHQESLISHEQDIYIVKDNDLLGNDDFVF